ncbi:hypothetical protein EJ994_11120 [Maribacter sp. MJ134]|uniref:DUF6090 family protein n=1 Tax=Maribacter sp. MJ134 TaxID=2496865 RepID=UPI000F84838A|nr:DUF6090 family protein [Maribacter sp. MJ134]AZQ59331.1 hypothetical protein EJ994_11120 [Maribacter sp. MJ134]
MKFFRKIRQKLVVEKKIRNYLLYAIGEIILVVIGILIALAINNGQQKRILEKKEQTYLKGLKTEFQFSKLKLNELIGVNRNNYKGAKKIIKHISEDTMAITEKQFSELLYNSFVSGISFNPNNSLLNEMINSGSLKDLSNPQLRMDLTNWISTLDDIGKQENELALQREKVLDMFRNNENSIRTIFDLAGVNAVLDLPQGNQVSSNLHLLDSQEFENNILTFMLTTYATENAHYTPLMESLDAILEILDTEIKE